MHTAAASALAFSIAALFSLSGAVASSCSPSWSLAIGYRLRSPDVQQRLGDELARELRKLALRDQWRMMIAGAHILIEATPARVVDVRNHDPNEPARRIIEYRNVTWLRDLRAGAVRPDQVTVGVTYTWCDTCNTVVAEDRQITFDHTRHILPADPDKRYVIGLATNDSRQLERFANSLTESPIADMGDPSNGCTNAFYMEAMRPANLDSNVVDGWGSLEHWETGDKVIARFREHPQLR